MKGAHLGEFEELVLLAVRQLAGDATGASVQASLRSQARRRATLGAIYAALDRGERKGLVTSQLGDPVPVPGGRRRRYYVLTRAGHGAIRESRRVRNALWESAEVGGAGREVPAGESR